MNYSTLLEKWVYRYMPLIVQTELDINAGFGLVAVFYNYVKEKNAMEFHYVFKVRLVDKFDMEGESAYSRSFRERPNRFMSFFYMTFNRIKYKRTADVDTLIYHGVPDLSYASLKARKKYFFSEQSKATPQWSYIELVDYSGDSQSMRKGDKFNLGTMFSLVYHHNAFLNYNVWTIIQNRPVVYLNISYVFTCDSLT